jgi:hypothetical protein
VAAKRRPWVGAGGGLDRRRGSRLRLEPALQDAGGVPGGGASGGGAAGPTVVPVSPGQVCIMAVM